MLDGVPCSGRACYSNAAAKTAGVGVNDDGMPLKWGGTFWTKLNNLDSLVSTGSTYLSKSATAIVNIAPTNLVYYTNILGSTKPTPARDACLARGLTLPIGNNSSGVGEVPRDGQEFVIQSFSQLCSHGYTLATSSDCKGYYYGWNDVRKYRCVSNP